ncbi:cleavage stimulation factor subunit 2 tau variant [Episyrphus balteatus]|uniref:cleavage stimulation factor subunit 2 tau variant n=1 Tax=Episyrphus balteatus TaxID=286459 RepID=UPI002486A468|nr:cleavage stimulation factor subunit 2 tau variant [Episyrphus balteatus]
MGDKNQDQSIMDKSMRSVFVGNIPYEATEEKLKEIFSEVGPVLSLKLVFDRESGKPKGYGFCEYKDQETALSAMRNLNGYEIGGRTLRVDNACTEKSRMEMQQLLQGPQVENPYGDHCDPDEAPEIITKTVASLPPEQMYELMRQMKLCIQNNPSEARQMLLMNPQLAYALLQCMVVMRIVDPQNALAMLFKANQMPPVLGTNSLTGQPQQIPLMSQSPLISQQQQQNTQQQSSAALMANFVMQNQDVDLRAVDPRVLGDPRALADPRAIQDTRNIDPRMGRNMDQDMRALPNPVPPPSIVTNQQIDPRAQRMPQPVAAPVPFPTDPRQRSGDPRLRPGNPVPTVPQPVAAPQTAQQNLQSRLTSNGIPSDASDQEKAALIMQVLQLSDEQIAMLPPEQRASILVLKEQIAKSTQR